MLQPDGSSTTRPCHPYPCRLAQDQMKALVPNLSTAQPGAAGLLVEVKGADQAQLDAKIQQVQHIIRGTGVAFGGHRDESTPLEAYPFKKDAKVWGRKPDRG